MPFDDTAGFGVAYAISHHALKQRVRLQARDKSLVLGAAGGVGVAAVELSKAMGATGNRSRVERGEAGLCGMRSAASFDRIVKPRQAPARSGAKSGQTQVDGEREWYPVAPSWCFPCW